MLASPDRARSLCAFAQHHALFLVDFLEPDLYDFRVGRLNVAADVVGLDG